MARWQQVIEEYERQAATVPSLGTLARWLKSSLPLLDDCDEMVSHGRLHIYKKGTPHTHMGVWNCAVAEYLEISFVTTWIIRSVRHTRSESIYLPHAEAPAYLSDMLARLTNCEKNGNESDNAN